MRPRPWLVFITALVCGGALGWYAKRFHLPRADPQGEANKFCDKEELGPVPSARDFVVTAHITTCDTLGSDTATYVYVHSSDEPESGSNLVLRYDGSAPNIAWISRTGLKVSAKNVFFVSKQVSKQGDVSITYSLAMTPR